MKKIKPSVYKFAFAYITKAYGFDYAIFLEDEGGKFNVHDRAVRLAYNKGDKKALSELGVKKHDR